MVHRIYEVTYEEKWRGSAAMNIEKRNVLGGLDALEVVNKLKKEVLSQTIRDPENGKVSYCIRFRLREIKILAET